LREQVFINCLLSFFREQKETLNTVPTHIYPGIIMTRDMHVGLISTIFVMLFIAACFAGCTTQAPAANTTAAPTTAAPVVNVTTTAPVVNVTTTAPAVNVTTINTVANVTTAAPAVNVTTVAKTTNVTTVATVVK
jgi:hypothetical protein